MSTVTWMSSVAALTRSAALSPAVAAGEKLAALWPLHDHTRIDNDVKYAENFQVRMTRQFALMLCGEDVTMPDAEYVYEGADEIPGRPQQVVDALTAANDAFDETADFSVDADPSHIIQAARILGVWNDGTEQAAAGLIAEIDAMSDGMAARPLTDRFAFVMAAFAQLAATCTGTADETEGTRGDRAGLAALPAVLYGNELGERLGVPIVYAGVDDIKKLSAIAAAGPDADGGVEALAAALAELAEREWTRHHDDVLWDPDEAKKRAKEEDERKNKEALAAKFAHVPEEPGKEPVEL